MDLEQKIFDKRSFDLVIKVAERCNLNCTYCYYFNQDYSSDNKSRLIRDDVIQELPDFLLRSLEKTNLKVLNIVFHGGEPLLLGTKKFSKICKKVSEALTGRVEFSLGVQTNGVLINKDWIDVFEKYNVHVGVSLDGDEYINDENRRFKNGSGSYYKARKGIQRLKEAYREGRISDCGAISVWHESEAIKQLDHLINEIKISSPNFNLPRGGSDVEYVRKWNQNSNQHRNLAKHYLKNYVYPRFIYMRGISEKFFAIKSERGAIWNDFRIAQQHCVATISSDGDLLIDDNLLGVQGEGVNALTIFNSSLADLLKSEKWAELTQAIDSPPEDCRECRWHRICRGGSLYNRYNKENGYKNKSSLCETLFEVFDEISDFLIANELHSAESLTRILNSKPAINAEQINRNILGCHEPVNQ